LGISRGCGIGERADSGRRSCRWVGCFRRSRHGYRWRLRISRREDVKAWCRKQASDDSGDGHPWPQWRAVRGHQKSGRYRESELHDLGVPSKVAVRREVDANYARLAWMPAARIIGGLLLHHALKHLAAMRNRHRYPLHRPGRGQPDQSTRIVDQIGPAHECSNPSENTQRPG